MLSKPPPLRPVQARRIHGRRGRGPTATCAGRQSVRPPRQELERRQAHPVPAPGLVSGRHTLVAGDGEPGQRPQPAQRPCLPRSSPPPRSAGVGRPAGPLNENRRARGRRMTAGEVVHSSRRRRARRRPPPGQVRKKTQGTGRPVAVFQVPTTGPVGPTWDQQGSPATPDGFGEADASFRGAGAGGLRARPGGQARTGSRPAAPRTAKYPGPAKKGAAGGLGLGPRPPGPEARPQGPAGQAGRAREPPCGRTTEQGATGGLFYFKV